MLAGRNPLNPGDAAGVVDLVVNGGFEAEGSSLSGWRQIVQTAFVAFTGAWSALQETTSTYTYNQVPTPPQGDAAAVADSAGGASILALLQEIAIPSATSAVLGVDVLVLSDTPFVTRESLDIFPLHDPKISARSESRIPY
jgi:hypothetical protein